MDAVNTITKRNFITYSKLGSYGRLGNQLFQIAAVLASAKTYKKAAKFPRWYCNYDKIYYSDYFKNKLDETLDVSQIKLTYREPRFDYTPIPIFKEPVDLQGYYQSENHFRLHIDEIRHYFTPTDSLIEGIYAKYSNELEGMTCSIHVRRGDYTGNKTHDVCDMEYYNKCIANMRVMGINKFVIFSDDINWCKANFTDGEFHFIEGNNPIVDLFTMSLCKHNIIANSSFSWWGSWLNKNPSKVVYAPGKWFTDTAAIKHYQSIYRKDIIKI